MIQVTKVLAAAFLLVAVAVVGGESTDYWSINSADATVGSAA